MPAKSILCYVTDRRSLKPRPDASPEQALLEFAIRAARAGIDWIQIREKDLPARALLRLTTEICRSAAPSFVFVNDRLDIALAAGAGGVHLGEESLPVAAVRRFCTDVAPAGFRIGRSCHSLLDAEAAQQDGADYVFFGPVYPTPSKFAYGRPQGIARLGEVCRAVSIPVIAIGGITPQNAEACIAAGAAGLAAIRWFQQSEELAESCASLRAACP